MRDGANMVRITSVGIAVIIFIVGVVEVLLDDFITNVVVLRIILTVLMLTLSGLWIYLLDRRVNQQYEQDQQDEENQTP